MIDMIKGKTNYNEQQDNLYSLEKEPESSLKRITELEEERARDLNSVMAEHDLWRMTSINEPHSDRLVRLRSSSWDSSKLPDIRNANGKALNTLHEPKESIDAHMMQLNATPMSQIGEAGDNMQLMLGTSQFSIAEQRRSLDERKFLPTHSHHDEEKRYERKKTDPIGPHMNGLNGYIKKDDQVIVEVEKIQTDEEYSKHSESKSMLTPEDLYFDVENNAGGENVANRMVNSSPESATKKLLNNQSPKGKSPSKRQDNENQSGSAYLKKEQKVTIELDRVETDIEDKASNNNGGTGSNKSHKVFKPAKTAIFEDSIVNKGISDSVPNARKIRNHFSPENSVVQKDPVSKARYDRDFFKKHIMNRTGIPTITAKKREATKVLNFDIFSKKNEDGPTKGMNISLWKELDSIEKQKILKKKMEDFVLLFNKNANAGIAYLISENLVADTPENIANVLLVTEGLYKETIGELLGSYKERNKEILKAYCELLDFRKLEFDQALRLLLSRFKLPGEAQQIERIVSVFANVYHADNPNVFADEDTPFTLAYSLLMLNTDAHSSTIPTKNKMTKQQFVENNYRIMKTLKREYLGEMYDRIVKQKFTTKADHIEVIYKRLYQGNEEGQILDLDKEKEHLAKKVIAGANFTKYGHTGKSHERRVWISAQEDEIYWVNQHNRSEKPRMIRMADVRDVLLGHNSTQTLVKNKVPNELDSFILSIITNQRTLDLKANDIETRSNWERYFRLCLLKRKEKPKNEADIRREEARKQIERDRLSEIWKVEILPHWETHWDYEIRKPKNVSQIYTRNTDKKGSKSSKKNGRSSSSVWNIFKRQRRSSKKYEKASIKNAVDVTIMSDEEEGEFDFNQLYKNKSTMLVSLWKKGIPNWLRSTLWPICIGNQLEVTEHLYDVLLSQAKIFLDNEMLPKSAVSESFKVMQQDLEETFQENPIDKEQGEALVRILEAFVFYRPDIGYVKGMCRLVTIILLGCSNEYQAFSCFTNLTHSHHFLSFFRGNMREIEWRITFFNKVFEEEIPYLYAHFRALDLSSEMFILDWFLSLFSVEIKNYNIISRIWDCFLLEGEVYAIKTGVGILKYFELELKMRTFDSAINFLKKNLPDLDEDRLFYLIENVDVSWQDFQNEVRHQRVAEINSKVHQALLEIV